jgi:DNA-binding response OmpR family regulator
MAKNNHNSSKKVLIIEDDDHVLKALEHKFKYEGFNVLTAKDGVEGLESSLKNHPDLILLDIIMPKMDGVTMLKKLRQDQWGAEAKVIILTNLSEDKEVLQALESRVYDYLVKSDWKLEDLVKKAEERLAE